MDARSSNATDYLPTSIKLTGLDLMFGLPRSEWVSLYRENIDLDKMISSLHEVLEYFPVLKGRLVRREGHLYVEQFDAGPQIEVLESDSPAPAMGPDVFPFLANGLVPDMLPVPLEEQEKRPIFAVRYIRHSDGRYTVGTSICHGVVDAAAVTAFFAACRKGYFGEPIGPPILDRSIVLKLAAEGVTAPTQKSGLMLKPFDMQLFAKPPQPSEFFGMILKEVDHVRLAKRVKERFEGAFSFNNYLQAMLMKVFAQSSEEKGVSKTHANMSYDLRRMGPAFVPANYFGGATIFRSFSATFDELRLGGLQSIAQRFKELGKFNPDDVKQDVGYVEAQYESGNINDFGTFSEFLTPLLNGGFYINNLLVFGRPEVRPTSNLIWSEMPLRMPFFVRMATLLLNHDNDISIRIALPVGRKELFLEKWAACIEEELSA